jgi:surface glycoprotein (TIGR04207 family)
MIEEKKTVQDRGIAIALSALMVLSVIAVGAAAITPAAAQTVDQADRSAETTQVQPGDTVNVTVDVVMEEGTSFTIDEGFDPAFADTEIVDSDGASFQANETDRVVAQYGTLGNDPRGSATLVYEVTIPDDAEAGDTFEISSREDSDVDAGTTELIVSQEAVDASRTLSQDVAEAGSTVEVTVDVAFDEGQSFTIDEGFDPAFADTEIVDSDGASFQANETDRVVAQYGTLGNDPRGSATLVYEVTIPDDAEAGDTFEISSREDSDVVLGTDEIEVVEDALVGDVSFSTQATASSTFTQDGATAPGVAVDVQANFDAAVVVTYGDNLTIAGLDTFDAEDLDGSGVVVPVEDAGGFPGEHVAHVIPVDALSSDYAPGDEVSDQTASAVVDNDAASVLQGQIDFADQNYQGATDELTLDASLAGDDDVLYTVDVHPTDDEGNLIGPEYVGSSDVLSGSNEDVTIDLQDSNGEDVTFEPGTDDTYVAMIHVVDDDSVEEGDDATPGEFPVLPHVSANGVVPGGVTDPGAVTVTEESVDVNGDGNLSKDLDGDGYHEDVDGDGEFSIADVQVLFNYLESDEVQNNADLFNFDGEEPADVTIGDVQVLFQML